MMTSKPLFRGCLIRTLPLAAFAGLSMKRLDDTRCEVSVPYGWRTQNPFRSTYFAALSMAAEMATGAPAMLAAESAPQSVAMLIVGLEASFEKKANDTATFVCEDGPAYQRAIEETLRTGQPVTVRATAIGSLPDGTVVARFNFTWSFKKRSKA